MIIALSIFIGAFVLVSCSDSKHTGITLKSDLTVGKYTDSTKIVKLNKGDTVGDIQDIGDGWVKFKSNGKELTCPKQKLDRSN